MKLTNFFKYLWDILVIVSIIGVITFITTSCILAWFLSLTFIIHLNPDYDITYLSFLVVCIIRSFIFEVIILIIQFILVPAIKSIIKKRKKR